VNPGLVRRRLGSGSGGLRRRGDVQLLLSGGGSEIGKDRRVHQLGQLLLAEVQFVGGDRLLNPGEDDAADAKRGGPAERVGIIDLRPALVDQVDEAVEGFQEEFLGPFPGSSGLHRTEVGDALVTQEETQHRVGGGTDAVAPTADPRDRSLGVIEELAIGFGENSTEAVFEIVEVTVKGRVVEFGAPKQIGELEFGVAALSAKVEQCLAQAGALIDWVGAGNGSQARYMMPTAGAAGVKARPQALRFTHGHG
jgi:hypothetical protein